MTHDTITSGAMSADAANLPAFITDLAPRRRRVQSKGPVSVTYLPDGAVRVGLFGRLAAGRSMTLDADVWEAVRETYGDRWALRDNGRGRHYVRATRKQAGAIAGQRTAVPTATLARIIAQAARGEVVRYRDGDPTNLRKANLDLLGREDAARFKRYRATA